ncbi:hypothetical protein BSKO_11785 [Bryopsis sp. KO-2023]|nr:hypothetical protein BSKO_11785 [Bryopsis sp. KO-2023]
MCIALVVVAFMMTYVVKLVEGEREVEVVVEEKGRFWDENGIYWGRYYGTIAHGFDKPVYKTCKAPSTATADSDQPSPSFFDDFMAAFYTFLQGFGMGLLYHWWSGSDIVNIATIYKGINFAVEMTLTAIQRTFIKSADFTTFYTIEICQQIRRKLGLPV